MAMYIQYVMQRTATIILVYLQEIIQRKGKSSICLNMDVGNMSEQINSQYCYATLCAAVRLFTPTDDPGQFLMMQRCLLLQSYPKIASLGPMQALNYFKWNFPDGKNICGFL